MTDVLRSGREWLLDPVVQEEMKSPRGTIVELRDDDGWRRNDGVTLDTPITIDDFWERMARSTVLESDRPLGATTPEPNVDEDATDISTGDADARDRSIEKFIRGKLAQGHVMFLRDKQGVFHEVDSRGEPDEVRYPQPE